jgi:hypothetical protein
VVQNGRPLADAWIEFQPDNGRTSIAVTNSDGQYEMYYGGSEMGAKIGTHTVRIGIGGTADPKNPDTSIPRVRLLEQSGVDIKAGENVLDFDVPAKGATSPVAGRPKTST